jgi:hypothetical protein
VNFIVFSQIIVCSSKYYLFFFGWLAAGGLCVTNIVHKSMAIGVPCGMAKNPATLSNIAKNTRGGPPTITNVLQFLGRKQNRGLRVFCTTIL